MTWEDGTPVTCEDIKYGVSRTFATDVITDGPRYAIQFLDIPKDKDGNSVYKGPYVTKGNDTAAFDKAVVCDGNKITFHLTKPVGDFNYTVTLTAFAPVPKAADTGEKYDDKPVSERPVQDPGVHQGLAARPGPQRQLGPGDRQLPSGLPGQDRREVRPRRRRSSTSD